MPAHYVVQAEVVDIGFDTPLKSDTFVIDTNVWFWSAYTKARPSHHQRASYPLYLKNALTVQAVIHRFALSQAEIFHLIEKTERELFLAGNLRMKGVGTKEFRHNFPVERARVVAECRIAWHLIKILSLPFPALVDDAVADAALARFQNQALDGYDLFLLEAMQQANLRQVLTDDGDFCTVPGIQVFTANRNVIAAASAQGKLVTR